MPTYCRVSNICRSHCALCIEAGSHDCYSHPPHLLRFFLLSYVVAPLVVAGLMSYQLVSQTEEGIQHSNGQQHDEDKTISGKRQLDADGDAEADASVSSSTSTRLAVLLLLVSSVAVWCLLDIPLPSWLYALSHEARERCQLLHLCASLDDAETSSSSSPSSLSLGTVSLMMNSSLQALLLSSPLPPSPLTALDPAFHSVAIDWQRPCTTDSAGETRCKCLNSSTISSLSHTCSIPPSVLLAHYYQPVVSYLPHVLTYRPLIDCNHGHYVMVDSWLPDGVGSTLAGYNLLLDIALMYRLQLVDPPFVTTHINEAQYSGQDPHVTRRRKLRLFEWHVSKAQLDACPANSPIHTNTMMLVKNRDSVRYTMQNNDVHQPLVFTKEQAHTQIINFITQNRAKGQGFIIHFQAFNGDRGCAHRSTLVHAIRAAVDPSRIRDQLRLFRPTVDSSLIQVGIHVRRSDLVKQDTVFNEQRLLKFALRRIISLGMWESIIAGLFDAVPWSIARRLDVTIFSEGDVGLGRIEQAVLNGQRAAFVKAAAQQAEIFDAPPVRWATDLEPIDSMFALAESEILLASPSDFSYAACMFNPWGLKIGIGWLTRWHGCWNHFELHVDRPPIRSHHPDSNEWIDEHDVDRYVRVTIPTGLAERIESQVNIWKQKRTQGVDHDPRYPFDWQLADGLSSMVETAEQMLQNDIKDGLVTAQEAETGRAMIHFLRNHSSTPSHYSDPGFTYDAVDLETWWLNEGLTFL